MTPEAGLETEALLMLTTMMSILMDPSQRRTPSSTRLTSSSLRDTPSQLLLQEIVPKALPDYLSYMRLSLPANSMA
jgi:hypothetical protein